MKARNSPNMRNIITICFDGKRQAVASPVYQWNYGMILRFADLDLPSSYEVHFSYGDGPTTDVTVTDSNEVMIPNELLRQSGRLRAYIYIRTERSGRTMYEAVIPIIPRPEPERR